MQRKIKRIRNGIKGKERGKGDRMILIILQSLV
jgi:hypothetical protein